MKKILLMTIICLGSLSSHAYDYQSMKGDYVVKREADCSGDTFTYRMSSEILIRKAGVYSELKVTPTVVNNTKSLLLEIRDGSPGSSEITIPLNGKKFKVEKNKISYKSKGHSRIGSCDLLGMDIPCLRNEIWDHSWSLTFEKNIVKYTWSSFDKSGSCKFKKLK